MQFNREAYLFSKRMATIQKARLPLQMRIQMIFNKAVDERILAYFGEHHELDSPTVPAYKEEVLKKEIGKWNLWATLQEVNRRRKVVSQNSITRMETYNASKQISDKITQIEVERIDKNLATIDKVLENAELNISLYKHLTDNLPATMSRKQILEEQLETGISIKGSREFTYRELNQLSRDLEKYRTHSVDYEQAIRDNRQASREGLPPVWTKKTWIWRPNEKTRHSGMKGTEVRLMEKFLVVNDVTGDVDELRFPHDVEFDSNGCSNLCNCKCEYKIT